MLPEPSTRNVQERLALGGLGFRLLGSRVQVVEASELEEVLTFRSCEFMAQGF